MPHGKPDWGHTNARVTTFPVTDLGELAVRLGSIVTYDRRGDVVWYDDFESTLNKWGTLAIGAGASIAISNARARNGNSSVHLIAGSAGLLSARITHFQPLLRLSRFGLECSFADLDTNLNVFTIQLDVFDGANVLSYGLRYDHVNSEVQYLNSSNTWTTAVTIVALSSIEKLFHTFKLIIDAVNGRYIGGLLDDVEIDLSGISALSNPSAIATSLQVSIENISISGQNTDQYVDDVIITQNEP